MKDESLIDEMRTVLRGDRDRAAMRQRASTPAPPDRAHAVEESDAPRPAPTGLVKRLLRRG